MIKSSSKSQEGGYIQLLGGKKFLLPEQKICVTSAFKIKALCIFHRLKTDWKIISFFGLNNVIADYDKRQGFVDLKIITNI